MTQRPPHSDSSQPKPSAAHMGEASDYQRLDKSTAQHPDVASTVREPVGNTPSQTASSSPAAVSVTLTKPSAPPQVSESSVPVPGPPKVSSSDVASSRPHIAAPPSVSSAPTVAAPPRLSSPPLMVHGLGPSSPTADVTPPGSKRLSAGPLPATPPKLYTLPSLADVSRPAVCPSAPLVSSPSPSGAVIQPTESSLPPAFSAPISSLQQMVHGPKPPVGTSFLSETSSTLHEAPRLTSATTSTPGTSVGASPDRRSLASPTSVPRPPSDPSLLSHRPPSNTPQTVDSGLVTGSAPSPPPEEGSVPPLSAQEHPVARPLTALPLRTTQASRTAPVSAPPALVSVSQAVGASAGASSDPERHRPNSSPPRLLKQSSLQPDHRGQGEDRKAHVNGRNPEEPPPQRNSGPVRTPWDIRTPDAHTHRALDPPPQAAVTPESAHRQSLTVEHVSENRFDDSYASRFNDSSAFDTPSGMTASSLGKTSLADADSSCADESSHFDDSYHPKYPTSRFGGASRADEEPSTGFHTTADSFSSVEDSRGDTLDSTRDSSTLQSSQMEGPPVDSSEASLSHSFGPPDQGHQGTF